MRIAMFHVDLPPQGRGGVAFQVDLLARTLVARGHRVDVYTTTDGPKHPPYSVRKVSCDGRAWTHRLWGVARAFREVQLSGYDVVHAHGDDWLCSSAVPRLRTFYGSAAAEALAARNPKRMAGQMFAFGTEWIAGYRAQHCTRIAESNRWLRPVAGDVVPCAVAEEFSTASDPRDPMPTVLYVAGTLGGRKRGHLLLEAFRQVRQQIPEARLILACPESVAEPGIENHSGCTTADLAGLYARSWVLCSASSYEGFGVPYAEALTAGLPVVTTSNPGAREVLADGRLGVLTTPRRLASDLLELLLDEGRRDRLSDAGRLAARHYAAAHVAEAYERRYRELISEHSPHSARAS